MLFKCLLSFFSFHREEQLFSNCSQRTPNWASCGNRRLKKRLNHSGRSEANRKTDVSGLQSRGTSLEPTQSSDGATPALSGLKLRMTKYRPYENGCQGHFTRHSSSLIEELQTIFRET